MARWTSLTEQVIEIVQLWRDCLYETMAHSATGVQREAKCHASAGRVWRGHETPQDGGHLCAMAVLCIQVSVKGG
ncbi:hypothetical protein AWB74_08679 [Caballeronia arvi]|uniref:Uncharacterized protein n=1 Tax=Caballeronia arvi TaxID=1777135 RepID=A0A158L6X7_9BURK|nr:hypothetical protein AWB74_08679 [Caballeronia arvi]